MQTTKKALPNQFRTLCLLVALNFIFSFGFTQNNCSTSDRVTIPDPELGKAIRLELGITTNTGSLFCSDLQQLTSLFWQPVIPFRVNSLEGLQYAKNLQMLHLEPFFTQIHFVEKYPDRYPYKDGEYQGISDILPLSELSQLRFLAIFSSVISDLSPLSHLSKLEELRIDFAPLDNLQPLSGLTQLKRISFSYSNRLKDLSPLDSLIKVEFLNLNNNIIEDIHLLVDNPGLGEGDQLYLQYNCLDLSEGSKALQDIQILQARGVQVEYEPQRDCANLE